MRKTDRVGMSGIGIASLVLIVVVLSMSVMAMLTLTGSRNDERLSVRSAQVTENIYRLYDRGERKLADLSALVKRLEKETDTNEAFREALEKALPVGVSLQEGKLCWQEDEDTQSLLCTVRLPEPGSGESLVFESCRIVSRTGEDETWN